MKEPLKCFKEYDVRGKLGSEFNLDIAYRIARAIAQNFSARNVVVGFDSRQTSPELAKSVALGICDAGANVFDIGMVGTEEMYWAVSEFNADAGIEVTASHNPIDYNGLKFVKIGSNPLSEDEFSEIKRLTEENNFPKAQNIGSVFDKRISARTAYINKILKFVNIENLRPAKIVINSGNGSAGPVIDALSRVLKSRGVNFEFVKLHHNPDSTFPNGIPNPLLIENRQSTANLVRKENANFGVAFDGDFDRCFVFDHLGNFIPGEYIVGLIAKTFLRKNKPETIIHDPRVVWNTIDLVKHSGGTAVNSKTGHVYMKHTMRQTDAVYGGEMSAHHYFRDFAYCDSGMIPWLLVWELLSQSEMLLSDLVKDRRRLFPSSGEINFEVFDGSKCIKRAERLFSDGAKAVDHLDGLSISFDTWRFNLRKSNTEPLVRLNVETKGDKRLLELKTKELTAIILGSK